MSELTRRPFYSEFAWAYDLIIDRPISSDSDGIVELPGQRGASGGARLLDAGCGAAACAVELARRGFEVIGIDASPELIAQADMRAREPWINVGFAVGAILAASYACWTRAELQEKLTHEYRAGQANFSEVVIKTAVIHTVT